MDIYTKQGNIIRQQPADDGTTEVELEFLFDDVLKSRLYAVAIYWMAFHERLHIDYVLANPSCTRAVVRQSDFDEAAQDTLVATMLQVRERSGDVHAVARAHLYGRPPSSPVRTNSLDLLRPREQTVLECQEFLDQLAARFSG
jgi:hypothetical protein